MLPTPPNHSISYKFFKSVDDDWIHSHQWCFLQTLSAFSSEKTFFSWHDSGKYICESIKLLEAKEEEEKSTLLAPFALLNMNSYWHFQFFVFRFVNTPWIPMPHSSFQPVILLWVFEFVSFFFEISTRMHHDVKSFQWKREKRCLDTKKKLLPRKKF